MTYRTTLQDYTCIYTPGEANFTNNATGCLCFVCVNMLSPSGLTALWSDVGYEHLGATACSANSSRVCRFCSLILETASWGYRDVKTVGFVFKASCARAIPSVKQMSIAGEKVPLSLDTLEGQGSYRKWSGTNMFTCKLAVFAHNGAFHYYFNYQSLFSPCTIPTADQLFRLLDDPFGQHFPGRPLAREMAGESVTKAGRSWLKYCQDSHPQCGNYGQKTLLPTRVIDVRSSDENFPMRLHASTQEQQDQYLALSYC